MAQQWKEGEVRRLPPQMLCVLGERRGSHLGPSSCAYKHDGDTCHQLLPEGGWESELINVYCALEVLWKKAFINIRHD